MKLSKETLALIKNFSTINSNLTILPGNKLTTISTGKNIIADVVIAEQFPNEFGIYDLNEFLGAMSLFESPDLEFSDKYVTIKEGKNSVKFFAASKDVLTKVPQIKAFPQPDIEFDLPGQLLQQILRVASILKVSDITFVGDGETVTINVGDKSNPTGSSFDSQVAVTDKTFQVKFKVENLKMMAGDYRVAIGAKKISRFQATNQQLTYYVAIELDSTFGF